MAIIQQLVNFDELFHQLPEYPVILNELRNNNRDDRVYINNLLYTKFTNEMLSTVPQCQCGNLKGEYCIGDRCDKCGKTVENVSNKSLEPIVWFRAPKGISGLLSPIIYTILRERMLINEFSILDYFLDTQYRPKNTLNVPNALKIIEAAGVKRGYNNFIDNFDTYVDIFLTATAKNKIKRVNGLDTLRKLIFDNRDKMISQYLPLPNKALLIFDSSNNNSLYVYAGMIDAKNIVESLLGIDTPEVQIRQSVKENRVGRKIGKLAMFYQKYMADIISKKPGIFRKHILGSRTYFSGRAVISSITEKHNYDEVYLPWGVGVTILRPHLINKLSKLGHTLNQSIGIIYNSVNKYNPLIDSLIKEIISETRDGGIYAIVHRNPSLLHGSAQRCKITRVKTDPNDNTMSFGILIVKAPNADRR